MSKLFPPTSFCGRCRNIEFTITLIRAYGTNYEELTIDCALVHLCHLLNDDLLEVSLVCLTGASVMNIMLCYVMLCYIVICKAPLTEGCSEALSA